MAKVDDKQIGVARVYSQSILGLAESQGQADDLLTELGEMVVFMERDEDFARFMESPLVDAGERETSLETMFRGQASDLLVDTLQILNRKGRLAILPTIYELYRQAHETLRGRVEVHIKTAVPMTDGLRDRLTETLNKVTGQEADLVEEVDENLLGGIVVRLGDRKYDGSVRYRINTLGQILHERGRQAIHESRRGSPI